MGRNTAIDYRKLTGDLIRAKKEAEVEALGEDEGYINLDTMTILLPFANSKKMIGAVKEAGLYTSGKRFGMGARYFIDLQKCGQSSKRKRVVQAMCESMKKSGWEAQIHSETEPLER